ncbi:PGPS1 [Scenedesmus sp. PABB004]|nr:PGPS1 [Scenedesmus sp. PABB004]
MAKAPEKIPLLGVNKDEESFDSPFDRRSEVYRTLAYEHRGAARPARGQPICTAPNLLTFLRLVLVPVVGVAWFSPAPRAPLLAAALFVVASLTDWLDGYIARKFEIVTTFGAFLDPVADKIMVTTVLVLLSTGPPEPISQGAMVVPVIIICCREVTMSALREWAASAGGAAHKAVKVNSLGKWKTALQMTSMSLLLFCKDRTPFTARLLAGARLGVAQVSHASWLLLWAAAALAAWSLAIYFANVWTHFVAPPPEPAKSAKGS